MWSITVALKQLGGGHQIKRVRRKLLKFSGSSDLQIDCTAQDKYFGASMCMAIVRLQERYRNRLSKCGQSNIFALVNIKPPYYTWITQKKQC